MDKDKQSDLSATDKPDIDNPEKDIVESIEKLESLIEETENQPRLTPKIPVLNDIVGAAEVQRYAQSETANQNIENIPNDRLNELVNTVDQKLSRELDSLVDILKDTIKDSIIDELKQQLKNETGSSSTANMNDQNKPSD